MPSPKHKQTAEELIRTMPGAFARRKELILALCRSDRYGALSPAVAGRCLVELANTIIEETEQ